MGFARLVGVAYVGHRNYRRSYVGINTARTSTSTSFVYDTSGRQHDGMTGTHGTWDILLHGTWDIGVKK